MLSMLMTTEYAPAEDRHELQQLLIHIAGGEREALAELYQRTRSAVYGLALSYLKNAHDAQDLTRDVYVQVWDRAEQYRLTGSPMGWLLDQPRQTIYALAQIRVAAGDVDLVRSGEIVQHRRRSSTSFFICSVSQLGYMSRLALPMRSVAERSVVLQHTCFGTGNSANATAGVSDSAFAVLAADNSSRSQR